MTGLEKVDTASRLALGLYEESAELIRASARYKAHVLRSEEIDKSNVISEVADVLKYTIALAQLHGVEPGEVYDAFCHKTRVVEDRANGERLEMHRDTKVILVDLDGCLADLSVLDDALEGLPTAKQEETKKMFRRSGGYINLPLIDGAKEGMAHLRTLGFKLVIITARPRRRHKRIHSDTLTWLKRNEIAYDLMLFKRDKGEAICEYVHPATPFCFIEDRLKHALEIVSTGAPVLLLNQDNLLGDHRLITRVGGWDEIINHITTKLKNEEKHDG